MKPKMNMQIVKVEFKFFKELFETYSVILQAKTFIYASIYSSKTKINKQMQLFPNFTLLNF